MESGKKMSFRLVLGTLVDKGERVVLTGKDAARHMHLIATTGAGKSKLLSSLFLQILNQGNGVALIDPAGDDNGRIIDDCLKTKVGQQKRIVEIRACGVAVPVVRRMRIEQGHFQIAMLQPRNRLRY